MNIVYLTNEYPPSSHGGIGNFIKEISESLVNLNNNVTVIGLYNFNKIEYINGVKVIRIKKKKFPGSGIINLFILRNFIKNYIIKNNIDIVEDNDWDLFSSILFNINCKIILRIHNRNLASYKNIYDMEISRMIKLKLSLINTNSIISVSKFIGSQLKRVLNDNNIDITNIYNGIYIENDFKNEITRKPYNLLFAGTLVEEKGIINLVKAWNVVLKENKNSVLHICGKDNNRKMENFLLSIVSDKNSLRFHGHVNKKKLYHLYKTCSGFISPSYYEAFSLVPLESMSNACPTIYTKLSSGNEIIKNNHDGLLINPHDIKEIYESIIKIFKDKKFAKKIARNGFNKVKNHFELKLITLQNLNHYKNLIK